MTDKHFSRIWESALSVPPDLRGTFYAMVAEDLKRLDPITREAVAAAISRALAALVEAPTG